MGLTEEVLSDKLSEFSAEESFFLSSEETNFIPTEMAITAERIKSPATINVLFIFTSDPF